MAQGEKCNGKYKVQCTIRVRACPLQPPHTAGGRKKNFGGKVSPGWWSCPVAWAKVSTGTNCYALFLANKVAYRIEKWKVNATTLGWFTPPPQRIPKVLGKLSPTQTLLQMFPFSLTHTHSFSIFQICIVHFWLPKRGAFRTGGWVLGVRFRRSGKPSL